jgi:ketosteroid isomerase-like protein
MHQPIRPEYVRRRRFPSVRPLIVAMSIFVAASASFVEAASPPPRERPIQADAIHGHRFGEDGRAIIRAHEEWVQAVNRGDYDAPAAMAMWARDLQGWAPGAEPDSHAREAAGLVRLAAKYPKGSSGRPAFRFEIVELDVDGDLAFVHVLWTMTSAEGVQQPTMRSFEIWARQEDATWQMRRYLESPAG